MTTKPLLLRALLGEETDRRPVWIMRQAGRFLPEYRELKTRYTFEELCADPDLACQVTLQPVDRFDVDAAIVFSDILPVLQAIGREITFGKGMGPQVPEPVRSAADLATLRRPDVADALPVVPETLRRFRKARPDVPIFGFAGAPFTLLCYLVEGGSSKSWRHTKSLLWSDPDTAQATQVGPVPGTANVGMTFLTDGTLLATDKAGGVRKIDPSTGDVTEMGEFGSGYATAGDLVAVADGRMFAISDEGPQGNEDVNNVLIRIDPQTGAFMESIGQIGFGRVFGSAVANNRIYAFTEEGHVIEINPVNGVGTLRRTYDTVTFWGAGVTPTAVID